MIEWGFSLALLLVLISLFARVDIATKALWSRLQRLRQGRSLGLAWRAAWTFALAGVPAISGASSLTETAHAANYVLRELDESDANYCREQITVASGQTLKAGAVLGAVALGIGRANIPTVTGSSPGNGTMTAVSIGPDAELGTYTLACIAVASDGGTFSVTTPSGEALPNATVGTPYVSSHINFTLNDGSSDFTTAARFAIVVSTTAPAVVGTGNGMIGSLSLGRDAKPGNYVFRCTAASTDAATFECFDPDGESLGVQALVATSSTAVFATPQINATITQGATEFTAGALFNVAVYHQAGAVTAWDPTATDGSQVPVGILWADVDASGGATAGVMTARATAVIASRLLWKAGVSVAQQTAAKKQLATLGIVAR